MSTIGDLGKQTVQAKNQYQFLGQKPASTRKVTKAEADASGGKLTEGATIDVPASNPLLELAQGIMGNAATAQGRGDMAFGGGGGVPFLKSYSTPSGDPYTRVNWGKFTTPTTLNANGAPPAGGGGGTTEGGVPPSVSNTPNPGGTQLLGAGGAKTPVSPTTKTTVLDPVLTGDAGGFTYLPGPGIAGIDRRIPVKNPEA